MTCYNCQKEIVDGARYCQFCGAAQKPMHPPPPPAAPPRPLRRSRKNKMIAGVCAGMAEHFEMDVALVRLIWALVTFFTGIGIILYLICWLVVPYAEEGAPAATPTAPASQS